MRSELGVDAVDISTPPPLTFNPFYFLIYRLQRRNEENVFREQENRHQKAFCRAAFGRQE